MGIGLGVIFGSIFRTITPTSKVFNINQRKAIAESNSRKKIGIISNLNGLGNYKQRKELIILSNKWKKLSDEKIDLQVSAYLNFEDGRYAQLNAENSLPAASSIKVPILLIALEMLDNKLLSWDELIELKRDLIASGSGWMRYQRIGQKFPIHEIATEMIRVSDNTATNLLIDRIGGIEILNKRFIELGLNQTHIKNMLPDLNGTNRTSAKDLCQVFQIADSTNFLSLKSRDLFREILSTSKTNSLLPDGLLIGLGQSPGNTDYNLLINGYRVYNKTGDIGISYADAGLIEMPDTSRATSAFIVKGPFNDPRSATLIRDLSAEIINHIKTARE
ncbi:MULTISPECIES: serine hydrolase [Prochlorococcus]|uniref:serine hydrolase n=1 Tax=Prochlorococcus TaxID=1218 RepID=UPI0009DD5393|nr:MULTISPECIES: serine hydrolase [Prochlorococcus]